MVGQQGMGGQHGLGGQAGESGRGRGLRVLSGLVKTFWAQEQARKVRVFPQGAGGYPQAQGGLVEEKAQPLSSAFGNHAFSFGLGRNSA